ncbi:MAG: YgaP-like transmembrane domain [Halobacteriaceae archaeon]
MNRNVGGIDRTARLVLGVLAVVAGVAAFAGYLSVGAVVGAVALVAGGILLVTGTTQKCPVNEAAGIDTTE